MPLLYPWWDQSSSVRSERERCSAWCFDTWYIVFSRRLTVLAVYNSRILRNFWSISWSTNFTWMKLRSQSKGAITGLQADGVLVWIGNKFCKITQSFCNLLHFGVLLHWSKGELESYSSKDLKFPDRW